jgi:GntR family transcriptional regulator
MSPSTSLVERVAAELEGRIASGAYEADLQLPGESDLCADLGVSRPTLRDAFARLEARGLIRREHGRGTYVNDPAPAVTTLIEANLSITEMIERTGLSAGTSDVTASFELPPLEVIRELGTASDEAVLVVRRTRTAEGRPAVLSVDYLPLSIDHLPKDAEAYYGSLYQLLEQCCGEPVAGALARIEPVAADDELARTLALAPGTLLLALHQTHELRSGRRVLCSVDYLRNDVFTIYVKRLTTPGGSS